MSVAGLMLLAFPTTNLAIVYWHWRRTSMAIGFLAFASHALDAKQKYLSLGRADTSLYDAPDVRHARLHCIIASLCLGAFAAIYESWPPCRILYNCVVTGSS